MKNTALNSARLGLAAALCDLFVSVTLPALCCRTCSLPYYKVGNVHSALNRINPERVALNDKLAEIITFKRTCVEEILQK